MNDPVRINELHSRINNLLAAVTKNEGRFTTIDKDLLIGYVREMYELVVAIVPAVDKPAQIPLSPPLETQVADRISEVEIVTKKIIVTPAAESENLNTVLNDAIEIKPINQPVQVVKPASKEKITKKSISEIYAHQQGSDQGTLNEKFKPQGKEIADRLKHTPIKDLKLYIGLNKRFTFINTLFKGQSENYDAVVAKVNNAVSYQEALNYIQQQVMAEYGWKEEDPVVAEFFTLVMRRYLN
ncbi:MAG: hypothetical protein KBF32_05835 [Chitinophagales bacterium]|nr:hypothetical protein [Chitinophagales bacterium]